MEKSKVFQSFDRLMIEWAKRDKYDMDVQHYHDAYEIYLQLAGERYLFCDDVCYNLKQGDLVILKPFVLHYMESRELKNYERYVMNFSSDKLDFILSDEEKKQLFGNLENTVIHLDDDTFSDIKRCFEDVDRLSHETSIAYSDIREKLMYAGAVKLTMYIKRLADTSNNITNSIVQKEIVSAIHYINSRYNEPIDLDETAKMVHMSKYYFCRLFHKTTGVTFLTYLHNVRIAKAHRLLTETDLPLSEIAEKTGFTSVARMSEAFKKMYNKSPRNFRKEHKA